MARLKEFYKSDVAPAMMSKFGYKSVMQIPKLDKVVINVGCGELKDNPKMLDAIVSDLGKITGQMAADVLTGKADISTLAVKTAPTSTKQANMANCQKLGITVPAEYTALATE